MVRVYVYTNYSKVYINLQVKIYYGISIYKRYTLYT